MGLSGSVTLAHVAAMRPTAAPPESDRMSPESPPPTPVAGVDDRFFALSIDMLCVLGFDGYFKRLNPAWASTLGFSVEELMARPFIDFVHPDDRARTLAQNGTVRQGGQALAFENRYRCKDGSYRWLLWNSTADDSQQLIYAVARDVTIRREADADRERLVQELKLALTEVKTLRALLPVCSYCGHVRDDDKEWMTLEEYISRHTNSRFSHGICPSCMATKIEPELAQLKESLRKRG